MVVGLNPAYIYMWVNLRVVGKSFGFVDIDIECQNISILANIGGRGWGGGSLVILSTK